MFLSYPLVQSPDTYLSLPCKRSSSEDSWPHEFIEVIHWSLSLDILLPFLDSVVCGRGRYSAGRPVVFTSLSFMIWNCRSPFHMVPYLFMSNLEALFMSWSWDTLQSLHDKWTSVHVYWAQILSHLLWPGQFGVWTCKIVKFGKYKGVQKFEGAVRKSGLWYLFESSSKKKSLI